MIFSKVFHGIFHGFFHGIDGMKKLWKKHYKRHENPVNISIFMTHEISHIMQNSSNPLENTMKIYWCKIQNFLGY